MRFCRTATVQAATEVQCLTLDKNDVFRLIGNLPDTFPDKPLAADSGYKDINQGKKNEIKDDPDISLSNLATMSILGEGGFGKVELVKVRKQNRFYARKRIARTKINKKDMELEKQIMQTCDCKFIEYGWQSFLMWTGLNFNLSRWRTINAQTG